MPRKLIALSSIVGVLALLLASSLSSVRADETPEPARTPAVPTGTPAPTEPATFTPTPEATQFEESAQTTQTPPWLVIAGTIGCPVVLVGFFVSLIVLVWLRRQRGTPSTYAPYLELESTGLRLYLKRDRLTLGRGFNCDLRIRKNLPGADTVSHHHARLVKRDARWTVIDGIADDRPSANGIYVNGKRTLENYLYEDDEVAFGELKFRFHIPMTLIAVSQGDA
jgi:hypothetical protein